MQDLLYNLLKLLYGVLLLIKPTMIDMQQISAVGQALNISFNNNPVLERLLLRTYFILQHCHCLAL
jgi:hypothetical protein